ncbi:MAG: diguanylate cyclase [Marinobacter sp.]|uniref:diguanylate cyclase n=1 Tax=Marinobacter sp. TaxID=50741 RepID=UPI0029C4A800|nr:diguanylate cyclase [Marinobacter sp.]MDX5335581.1 diguanylate cyclase [Marinobacter sp.]MDX5386460.1 diguanylate cyclase [Marinobacter sp.]MDX5441207.1 diguanylate cyclase [Alteromonadaceae bacterium]MDX5471924.1 diguanylate cyclase [Marinobacter sp.]
MQPEQPERGKETGWSSSQSPLRRALSATLVYLVAGIIWITFSDRMVEIWFADPRSLSAMQTWKGFLFVAVTALVLFTVMLRLLSKDRLLLSLQLDQRRALRQREQQLRVLMDNLPGMAYRCRNDHSWTMLFVSGGCEPLTGYLPDDLINNKLISYASLMDPDAIEQVSEEVAIAVRKGRSFSLEYAITRKDGRKVWVWERGCGIEQADGSVVLEGIVLDISDRKQLETELEEMATRDPLTGLLNRREFSRVLEEELERARRYERPMALLWIDFDHFKDINDSWGHAAGDTVLCAVSEILTDRVRSVDSVGRFGGEEFVIVLPEMDVEGARDTAERLRQRVGNALIPLESGHSVPLTISVGVAVYPVHGHTVETLCGAADKAMYQAKMQGRNSVAMAQPIEPVHNET